MALNKKLISMLGGAFMAATALASPAHAIDPGCYPAEVVRAATWKATGADQQFTVITGARANDSGNPNYFTTNADGSVGYNIEKSAPQNDDGKLCIAAKYTDVKLNAVAARPSWVKFPAGSENAKYLEGHEHDYQARVIFGATAVVRGNDGREYRGPQLYMMTSDSKTVKGAKIASIFTNDNKGEGDVLFGMAPMATNANFDRFASATQGPVQTASLAALLPN